MKSAKKSLNQIVAKVLADIYAQPDLKQDVFDYLNPVVLKAYTTFSALDNAEGVAMNVKGDIEQVRQVENILSKELPNLIDIYTRLPIEYRNEKMLGNGLTHRQTLVKSLQVLVGKLVAIENQAYEKEDRNMTVGHDVLREKYQDNSSTLFFEKTAENGLEPEFHNSFDWQGYKEANPTKVSLEKALENEANSHYQDNGEDVLHTIMVDKNTGEMTIREKNRVRKWVLGKARVAGNILTNLFLDAFWHHPVRFVIITIICGLASLGVHFFSYTNDLSNLEQEMVAPQVMAETLNKDYSDALHDVTLDAMKRYAKNHGMNMSTDRQPENDNREVAWFEKTVNRDTCMNVIDKFVSEGDSFFINNTHVNVDQKVFPAEERQALCSLDKNVISTGYFTTPKGQKPPVTNTNTNTDSTKGDKTKDKKDNSKKDSQNKTQEKTHTNTNTDTGTTTQSSASTGNNAKILDYPESEKNLDAYANKLWQSTQNQVLGKNL